MTHWTETYIGRPYSDDYNCAHLLVDVQRNVFNRNVNIPIESESQVFLLSKQIDDKKKTYLTPIEATEIQDGDVVLMKSRGRLNHIGILAVINGMKFVLHNVKSTGNVTLHRLKDLEKYALSVEGFYRCVEDLSATE